MHNNSMEILRICKDVINDKGDTIMIDCGDIFCIYCPLSQYNVKDGFSCVRRPAYANMHIAEEFIKNPIELGGTK